MTDETAAPEAQGVEQTLEQFLDGVATQWFDDHVASKLPLGVANMVRAEIPKLVQELVTAAANMAEPAAQG